MAFLKKTSLQHSGNHRRTVFSTIHFISRWVIGLPLIGVVLSRGSRDDAGRSHCRPFPEAVVFTEEDVPNTAGITDGQSSAPELFSLGRAMTFTEEDVPSTQRESPTDTFSIKALFPERIAQYSKVSIGRARIAQVSLSSITHSLACPL
jgi:hypothetical protein